MSPILALIIANMIWGAAAPIFKFSLTNIPPFTLAFLRFFLAGFLFLPFILRFNFRSLTKRDWVEILLGSLFGMTINISFFFLGLQKSDSINAPIIASSGPLFLFLLSVIFLHEKLRLRVLGGMFISLLGVLIIIFSPILFDGQNITNNTAFEGNLMFVIATFAGVLMPLILKDVLKRINPFVVIFIGFFVSSFTFLPFMLNELKAWSFTDLNYAGMVGIGYGVIFSSAVAYYLYCYGTSKIAAQEIGVFTYIDPVVAVLVAIPLVHEYPTIYFFLGSILVFGGIYVSEGRIHYHPLHMLARAVSLRYLNRSSTPKIKNMIK